MPRTDKRHAKRWCYTLNNPTDDDHFDVDLSTYTVVGSEVGEEGTHHYQGYVQFKKEMTFAGVKKLLPRAHWEVASTSPWSNYCYCAKGEQSKAEWDAEHEHGANWGKNADINEHGIRPTKPKKEKEKDTTFDDALAAETVRDGIAIVKARRARDYCMHGEAIERNLKKAKIMPFQHKYSIESFNRPAFATQKTLLFAGPSSIGKTHFAAAHFKNPLVCSHIDKLKTLNPDHDGIVFDDMSFKHWPIEAVIHLVDQEFEREINVRYGTTHIPANTPKIFTHNTSNPFYNDEANEEQKAAIERRIQRVNILNNLY